ncbi:glycosyltransferase family 9 protein [Wenzhouxiangella marina]|uniref:ADP-heptose--LPS heptosyltransferase n=1 Tax=Wenzhouxiangella marina TaxID=1579979 RepID=A0A0K0XV21_9GAMM|nr:glycosyltransferase family 9 protein [Wenzhouxiangella marina]AKS41472.1 ADP-heptose--LPS heptosyltransferase [Wenzhouxiangella marina]MBB6086771.1 heptosyltransferase I [Wenzhouxiangella marina]
MTAPSAAPRSICLFRLSALGDVCNCVPMVRAIQARWPEARLTWIIGPFEHRLVETLPGVEFIAYDKRSGRAGRRALDRALAGRRFDVLLLAQVSLRASLVARRIRADRRIGFDRERSREGHGWFINERIRAVPFQHQALAFLEFARQLDADVDGVDRRLPIPEDARAFAETHQPEAGRAVLISPASSHTGRNWTVEGYAEVADRVAEEFGRPVILVGGPSRSERELGDRILATARTTPLDLIGQDTIPQLLAMLDRAACLITPDSGPAHFAAALGTPVVGLHAATWARRSGPLGSLEHCVDKYPEAARKFLGKAPEAVRWGRRIERPGVMESITPDEVMDRLRGILQAT